MNTSQSGNILVPSATASTSPNSQVKASAATLAAIQAAAVVNGLNNQGSTPTGRIWIPNNAKPFKCPVPGCDKAYKQQNGLKYHRLHGHCNSNGGKGSGDGEAGANGEEGYFVEEDKPFGCYVGPACGKKYKNMNGLRYHYQHSGAHGQIGLQMLTNGTHPPPSYPVGHKKGSTTATRSSAGNTSPSTPSTAANSGAGTVIMNQSTAEALLAAISSNPQFNAGAGNNVSSGNASRSGSRPNTPRFATPNPSRNASPSGLQQGRNRMRESPNLNIHQQHQHQNQQMQHFQQQSYNIPVQQQFNNQQHMEIGAGGTFDFDQ